MDLDLGVAYFPELEKKEGKRMKRGENGEKIRRNLADLLAKFWSFI